MPDIPPIRRKLVEEARDEDLPPGIGLHRAPPISVDDRPMYKGHKVGVPPGTPEQFNPVVPQMKRGGMVRKTGIYMMHKGERVLPKSLARRYREAKHG